MRHYARHFCHDETGAASVEAMVLIAICIGMTSMIAVNFLDVLANFAEHLTSNELTASPFRSPHTSP